MVREAVVGTRAQQVDRVSLPSIRGANGKRSTPFSSLLFGEEIRLVNGHGDALTQARRAQRQETGSLLSRFSRASRQSSSQPSTCWPTLRRGGSAVPRTRCAWGRRRTKPSWLTPDRSRP